MYCLITCICLWSQVLCLPTTNGKTKEGLCPKPRALLNYTTPCADKCSNDTDCAEEMKCCDIGCGLGCVYKGKLPDGVFTIFVVQEVINNFYSGGLGQAPGVLYKPGKCPLLCKLNISGPQCTSDQDCPENLKCCHHCGHSCIKAEKGRHCLHWFVTVPSV
ncbi:WAP four-disulfide core domain protein 2-like [Pelodytes ibericus]